MTDIPQADLDLIAEFSAQADVTRRTRLKYEFHLTGFSRGLAHPRSRSATGCGLEGATMSDVVRHLAYLLAGDRYPSRSGEGVALGASSRRNTIGSLQAFYGFCVDVAICSDAPVRTSRAPASPRIPDTTCPKTNCARCPQRRAPGIASRSSRRVTAP